MPKLEQLNSLGFMCSLNLVLNKKDLIKMELLLLETFGWNLCMPTHAHFIDYYLHASVQEGDLYNGWPLSSLSKTKAFMDKYTHYFLEVSLQGERRDTHRQASWRPLPHAGTPGIHSRYQGASEDLTCGVENLKRSAFNI